MRGALLLFPLVLAALALAAPVHGATIGWGCHSDAGVTNQAGDFLTGTKIPGGAADLSRGPLVQLMRQQGEMDKYLVTDPAALDLVDPDNILLQTHIGYGFGPPNAPMDTGAWFAANQDVADLAVGDILYVRVFNMPSSDVTPANIATLQAGVKDPTGGPVTASVTQVMNPENYYFDNLRTEPIPEPAALLFLVPGLAVWALRRKK